MKFLLDTCVISDFIKGVDNTINTIKNTNPLLLAVSSITVMEIYYGLAHNPEKAKKIKSIIHDFLSTVKIINFTEKEANSAGNIRADLRKSGTPIGAYDVLIVATALSNNLTLITSNISEFKRVENLKFDNWR